MNAALEHLKRENCDIDAALNRTVNDESFLLTCLNMAIDDQTIEKMGEAIKAGNVDDAFKAAHSLKGVYANVGLTPLYQISSEMTEILRAGSLEGLNPLQDQLMQQHAFLKDIIKSA